MTRLTGADLDAIRFTPDQLDAAFALVDIDDRIDPFAAPPARIALDHPAALFTQAFALGRRLAIDGVDFPTLTAIVTDLGRAGDLDAQRRQQLKDIRAKLKLFRFNYALFTVGHRYPAMTDHLTTALGHLQDGYKTGQRARVARKAWIVRLLLSRGPAALIRREWNAVRLVDPAGFRAFTGREIGRVETMLRAGTVTGADYHALRKIFSRQVAFYISVCVLRPDPEAHAIFTALATINGIMGERHDRLVEHRAAGSQDYHRDRFTLPHDLAQRIAAVVDCYRSSGL